MAKTLNTSAAPNVWTLLHTAKAYVQTVIQNASLSGEDIFVLPASAQSKTMVDQKLLGRLPLTLDIDGANPITLSIVATSFSSTATVTGTLNWTEMR